jgi:hypothetical protein
MLNKPNTPTVGIAKLQVLAILQDRAHTWSQIQAATQFNDDYLGIVLGELFLQRLVRTESKGDVRMYWLVPE